MNKKVNLNIEVIRQIIEDNRPFLAPIITIFAGIILIIFFVIPQFNGFSAKQNEISQEQQKLTRLKNSLSVLDSTSDNNLQKNLQITSDALPPDKNFALILNAISSAASLSGVSLGDFDFQIGDLAGNSAYAGTTVPSLRISLNISGTVEQTVKFMEELNKSVPISKISGVKSGGNYSSIDLIFYYKPFPPQNSIDPQSITSISQAQQKLLDGIYIPPDTSGLNILNSGSSIAP